MAQTTKRRVLIDIAPRKQQPGSGSSKRFLMTRTAQVKWPDFEPILKPLHWAVVGAAATRMYMPERATRDFDIAVAVADGQQVRDRLVAAGYQLDGDLQLIRGSRWVDLTGLAIDVIEGVGRCRRFCAYGVAQVHFDRPM